MPSDLHKISILSLLTLCLIVTACRPVVERPVRPTLPRRPSPTVSTECIAGSHVHQLTAEGETRTYRLYVPASYRRQNPQPLVVNIHGYSGNIDSHEAYSGFSTLAGRAGFIVVYPQGLGDPPTWDLTVSSKDVLFIGRLIDHVQAVCNIDKNQIYATGHSLGGGMAHRLACDMADRIAAIGPVSGAYFNAEPCTPARPVSVIAIHGTADSVIPYLGHPPSGLNIPQWASNWAKRDECNSGAAIVLNVPPVSAQQWAHCKDGADVILYTISGGEHGWPTPAAEFDVTQTIWDFFVKHPLLPAGN